MASIEDIRKRFTIYDFILWSTLICFGIILVMIHLTDTDTRKCIVYDGDPVDVIYYVKERKRDKKRRDIKNENLILHIRSVIKYYKSLTKY